MSGQTKPRKQVDPKIHRRAYLMASGILETALGAASTVENLKAEGYSEAEALEIEKLVWQIVRRLYRQA